MNCLLLKISFNRRADGDTRNNIIGGERRDLAAKRRIGHGSIQHCFLCKKIPFHTFSSLF